MFLALCALTVFLFNTTTLYNRDDQIVVKYSGTERTLKDKITWAVNESTVKQFSDGYWVVYCIERLMKKNSMVGTFSSNLQTDRPSLAELITGITDPADNDINIRERITNDDGMATKDVAICIHYDYSKDISVERIVVSNLNLQIDLRGDPLIWIGRAKDSESIQCLKALLPSCTKTDTRKEIVTAVGLHTPSSEVTDFLKGIIRQNSEPELCENAVFWLGQQNTAAALNILSEIVSTGRTPAMREQAVFAISLMTSESSIDTLISIALNARDRDVRSKAIFWIGQKASDKTEKILKEIVYNDDDTEIQKNALFALAQCNKDDAIPTLIKIAKDHPNLKIRKDAIFWLGNSEDPQAIEALVEIVKN